MCVLLIKVFENWMYNDSVTEMNAQFFYLFIDLIIDMWLLTCYSPSSGRIFNEEIK